MITTATLSLSLSLSLNLSIYLSLSLYIYIYIYITLPYPLVLGTISVNSSTNSNLKPKHLSGNLKGSLYNYIHQICLYYLKKKKSKPAIDLMSRMFANGPGDRGSITGRVIPKTLKMVLDAALLNTQHYKVRIKGKVEHGMS